MLGAADFNGGFASRKGMTTVVVPPQIIGGLFLLISALPSSEPVTLLRHLNIRNGCAPGNGPGVTAAFVSQILISAECQQNLHIAKEADANPGHLIRPLC